MTLLRIRIHEAWPQSPELDWALLEEGGGVRAEGRGAAAQWPAADACEIVLSAPQATLLRASVPRVARAERARALAYAVEDRLVREADSQHLTPLGSGHGEVPVLAIGRDRLRQVLAALEAAGRPASRAVSELQTTPTGEDAHLALLQDIAVLRRGAGLALPLDRTSGETAAPEMLPAVLKGLADGGEPVRRLVVHPSPGGSNEARAWLSGVGVEAVTGADHRWYDIPEGTRDLLHGEFACRGPALAWIGLVQPALAALTVLLAVAFAVGAIQWAWQRYALASREADIGRVFAAAFPQQPAVLPLAQARKQLDLARSSVGQLRSDDALALMAEVAEALGSEPARALRSLRYEADRLEFELPANAATADALALFEVRLAGRGVALGRQTAADGTLRLTARRETTR